MASSSPEGQGSEETAAPSKEERKPKREMTEEEKQKRNKMMVLGVAVIGIVAIFYWLCTSLTDNDEGNVKGRNGFNVEMPDADQGSSRIADKDKAYEMDGVKKSLQARHDLGSYTIGESDSVKVGDEMSLMTTSGPKNDETTPAKQKVQQSAEACNALSQTLGSFYQPSGDAANEELKSRIAELEQKLSSQTSSGSSNVDDQLALMEKSYQLAAKYMPTAQNGDGQVTYAGAGEQSSSSSQQGKKRKVSPVQQVTKTVVSALGGQCMDAIDVDMHRSLFAGCHLISQGNHVGTTVGIMVCKECFLENGGGIRMNQISAIAINQNEVGMGIGMLHAVDCLDKMVEGEVDGHNPCQMSPVGSQRPAIRGDTNRINPTGLAINIRFFIPHFVSIIEFSFDH